MTRYEKICPRCGRVNVRHKGAWSFLADPKHAEHCTWCGTNLYTGQRTAADVINAALLWVGLSALCAAAGTSACLFAFIFLWPNYVDAPLSVRAAPVLLGPALGLVAVALVRRHAPRRKPSVAELPRSQNDTCESSQGTGPGERHPG